MQDSLYTLTDSEIDLLIEMVAEGIRRMPTEKELREEVDKRIRDIPVIKAKWEELEKLPHGLEKINAMSMFALSVEAAKEDFLRSPESNVVKQLPEIHAKLCLIKNERINNA